jgi:Glycosyltransferase
MACRTPVVASAVGGIPEVVVAGDTGLLVDYDPNAPSIFESHFAAAVNQLAGDSALAARMGEHGRDRAVRDFTWQSIAERTIEVYHWAIEHRNE